MMRRRLGIATGLLVLATVAGCGGMDHSGMNHSGGSSSSSSEDEAALPNDVNQADVDFATQMVPHHQQALDMVAMTDGRTLTPKVAALVAQIRDAQAPEITTMTGWLDDWGRPLEATGDHSGHDMGDMKGMSMPGMMSEAELKELEGLSDDEAFARRWLELMIAHHQGAIAMAEAEVENGRNPEAIALAKEIASSQQAEITTMRQLLS